MIEEEKIFNTDGVKWKIVNFSRNKPSRTALKQLKLREADVISLPAELKKNVDAEEYIQQLVEKLEWSDKYLVILPGLALLAGMICRALAELQMPYQIINLMRSRDSGEFFVADLY